jgi:PTS system nitrogen regulatory IIA component
MFSDNAFRNELISDPDQASVYSRLVTWQPSLEKTN